MPLRDFSGSAALHLTEENSRLADCCRAALRLEELFHAGYVFGYVDADRIVLDFGDTNFPAIFEPAQLFELLDALQLALRQGGVFEQGVAAESVQAQVFEMAGLDADGSVTNPGDGGAGEIKGVFVKIEDNFANVGVHDVGGSLDGGGDGGDGGLGFFEEGLDGGIDGGRVEQGFVALHVDKQVSGLVGSDLGDAFGAGAVIGAGHAGLAAEGVDRLEDAVVVGGDDDAVDAMCQLGTFIDALNHGFAGQGNQRLSGKPGGTIAGGNNHDYLRGNHWRSPSYIVSKQVLL